MYAEYVCVYHEVWSMVMFSLIHFQECIANFNVTHWLQYYLCFCVTYFISMVKIIIIIVAYKIDWSLYGIIIMTSKVEYQKGYRERE